LSKGIADPISKEIISKIPSVFSESKSLTVTAKKLGLHRDTVRKYLLKEGIKTPRKIIKETREGHPKRVVYFTDPHDRHDLDKRRFELLAAFVSDILPDALICGGDIADFDSLNSHAKDDTAEGKLKPSYVNDLSSLAAALKLIDGIPKHIERYITLGNHENRIWRYENNNPATCGMMAAAFLDLLETYKWQVTPFKQYLNLYGVEFTHAPINAMGKEIGGKAAAMRIATDSVRHLVYGHTHARHDVSAAKLGPDNRHTRAYNGGCFLPDNFRFNYAKASQNRWEYGLTVLTIQADNIVGIEWIAMKELERRYG